MPALKMKASWWPQGLRHQWICYSSGSGLAFVSCLSTSSLLAIQYHYNEQKSNLMTSAGLLLMIIFVLPECMLLVCGRCSCFQFKYTCFCHMRAVDVLGITRSFKTLSHWQPARTKIRCAKPMKYCITNIDWSCETGI